MLKIYYDDLLRLFKLSVINKYNVHLKNSSFSELKNMARILNTFELVDGTRNSRQILYKNNLFNKHSGVQWRCMSCPSMITVNINDREIIKEPTEHVGHSDISELHIAVMKSIRKMKDEAYYDPDTSLKAIYDRNIKSLTSCGYLLGDIISRNDGRLLPFPNFRGTLAAIRKQVVPILPQKRTRHYYIL